MVDINLPVNLLLSSDLVGLCLAAVVCYPVVVVVGWYFDFCFAAASLLCFVEVVCYPAAVAAVLLPYFVADLLDCY